MKSIFIQFPRRYEAIKNTNKKLQSSFLTNQKTEFEASKVSGNLWGKSNKATATEGQAPEP